MSVLFILTVKESDGCQAANVHNVSCATLMQIVAVESGGLTTAFNKHSLDYGIGQINYKTAMLYKMDVMRLLTDREYALDRSAFILSIYEKQFKHKEPRTWPCRYHIGTGSFEKLENRCNLYLKKMERAK